MRKLSIAGLMLLLVSSSGFAQYKGKYEGWSTGYLFTGSLNARHYKAFTHLVDFGATASSSGTVGKGHGASFVSSVHAAGDKALFCVGGQGNGSAFMSACSTPAGQTKLVKSILDAAKSGGYDGVDMDWEIEDQAGSDGNAARVAEFKSFHKELRDSINGRTPRMIYTAALVFDWYPNASAAAAEFVDQANSMTYYDPVTLMPQRLGSAQLMGTPTTKVGVGFGWDTDNEITATSDIIAKCKWSIDNNFGGIMAWHIANASAEVLDSIAHYVTHDATTEILPTESERQANAIALRAHYDGMKRLREFSCIVPLNPTNNSLVDLRMYDGNGALVKVLFHGNSKPGNLILPMDNAAVHPGAYLVRLSAGSQTQSVKADIFH